MRLDFPGTVSIPEGIGDHGAVPYRFSTAVVSPEARADEWRAVSSDQFVPLDPTPIGPTESFKASLTADRFADCSWALIATTSHTVNRTKATIAQAAPGTVFVNLQLSGSGSLSQADRQLPIHQGDVAVIDTDRPFTLEYRDNMRMACFSIPKDEYEIDASPRIIDHTTSDGSVLSTFLRGLALGGVQRSQTPTVLARNLTTLLSRCPSNRFGSTRDQLVTRLRDVISRHHVNPDLTSTEVAQLLHVSRSSLYRALESHGLTVRGVLTDIRLEHAKELLGDDSYRHMSSTEIGAIVGFADASTFVRSFKRKHGVTPQAWRNSNC